MFESGARVRFWWKRVFEILRLYPYLEDSFFVIKGRGNSWCFEPLIEIPSPLGVLEEEFLRRAVARFVEGLLGGD